VDIPVTMAVETAPRRVPRSPQRSDQAAVLNSLGVLKTFLRQRTRTLACFGMIASWDYPAQVYGRLATAWPSLGFICSVNGEMDDFGGMLIVQHDEVVS
jgi:hypothetical protein